MSDWYRDFANSGVGTTITKQLGLPRPAVLRRHEPGQPLLPGPVVVGSVGGGRLRGEVAVVLKDAGVSTVAAEGERLGAVVLDATGLTGPADLAAAHALLSPAIKRLQASGRVVVLADPPAEAPSPAEAAARQALDGLVRSLAKELLNGSTANLVLVPAGAEAALGSPLRFFLSGRSAHVDGAGLPLAAAGSPAAGDGRPPAAGQGAPP